MDRGIIYMKADEVGKPFLYGKEVCSIGSLEGIGV